MNYIESFLAAEKRGVPLVSIDTADPGATIKALQGALMQSKDPKAKTRPIFRWTRTTGLVPLTETAAAELARICGTANPRDIAGMTGNLNEAAMCAAEFKGADDTGPGSIVFAIQAHEYIQEPAQAIAVWNLREPFKANRRMFVLLGASVQLSDTLAGDVLSLDEPLPGPAELETIVTGILKSAEIKEPPAGTVETAVAALTGLSAFAAEQAAAMALVKPKGEPWKLDLAEVWQRKKRTIANTRGLTVYDGPERFEDIAGNQNLVKFLRGILAGNRPPRGIVVIDEIEKALAGAGSDTSGVSQDFLGVLLKFMQDTRSTGVLLVGPPGTGKTMAAKASGNEAGVPLMMMDLGSMKGSLVGSSERAIRAALKVADAVTAGQTLFVATSNDISRLPSALRRRFSLGTFFVDLPSQAEQAKAWELYRSKFGIESELPKHAGWTGAEICACCDLADRLKCTLADAARYIVPIAKSAEDEITRLRREASGRYISAAADETYVFIDRTIDVPADSGRALDMTLEAD